MNVENQTEAKEDNEINNKKLNSNKGPYVLGEKLGEGAFAKVRLATQIQIKEKCAVKILEKKLLENTNDIQRLKKEIKILKKLRHRNIIQLYDIMESKRNLYFVMEYCKGGELFDYIVKQKRLKEPEACCFFQQIINGVEYLHNQGIIHRDLKPENLLLDDNNHIKISDFGLSTFYSKNNYLQTACGTPSYAPPEMLEGQEYNGEATDVWSCGIILYAMLCGNLPFSESQEDIIVKRIKSHDYSIPNFLSSEAKDLLNHILIINPKKRITIEQIKKHSWFNLVKPHLVKGINLEEDIIPVDDKILDMVKSYGFDPEECRSLLLKNKFCSLTTIYYLCLKKYIKENGKSISDLESDLFEEYINNPKNKIKKNDKTEDQKNNKTDIKKNDRHISPGKRLSIKKVNTTKTNRNNFFKAKRNGTPSLNCIKISSDKRNLKSTKDIKRGCILTENNNANTNVSSNINFNTNPNYNKEKINRTRIESIKEATEDIENIKGKNNKKNNLLSEKNNLSKNQQKNINATKNNLKKTQIIECETKNNSIQKKKNKNNDCKEKKILTTEPKTKPIKHETEKKPLITKFNLNEENVNEINNNINSNKPKNNNNSSINRNVNIINININNNNNNINNSQHQSISEKEISLLIQQKLKEINEIKSKNEENCKNLKNKSLENNSLQILMEEEDELKTLLNPLYLKDLNMPSINNRENTLSINSNTFSSIFQETFPNQTKTFISNPQNYSLKTENIATNNNTRPKSSLFQYLGNDIEKYMLLQGEKPINVINYIAKKLVASSFCGSFNFQSGHNSSCANSTNVNNINQTISFLKNSTENNTNSPMKSNGNCENKIENNSFDNNSLSKDTSLFINDDNNDEKDLNFKNLVSILNKKFKNYLSKEKLNKTEIEKKNNIIKDKNSKINTICADGNNKTVSNIKKDVAKINSNNSFNNNISSRNTINQNNNNNSNSHLLYSYSKNENNNNKINKINQSNLKYKNNNVQEKNQNNKNNKNNLNKPSCSMSSSKINTYCFNNLKSHYNTFLNISTNYDPGMDSRNSSVERSISINELRNFSCSPSHSNKKGNKNVSSNKVTSEKKKNYLKNRAMNLTKGNRNFNIILEDEEYKDSDKNKINNKKKRKFPVCQNKVTINLSVNEEINFNAINNKKNCSKMKTKVMKKNK